MTRTVWPSEMWTGAAALDELHHDIFAVLDELISVDETAFSAGYGALVMKLERAFAIEEQWMEEIDFVLLKCHREQHARTLGALHHVHSRVKEGDVLLGREVIGHLLPQWLAFHISTMDAVLAMEVQMTGKEALYSDSALSFARVD